MGYFFFPPREMGIGSIQIGKWNQTQNLSKSVWQWPFCVSRQSFRVPSVITDPKTSRWLIITPYNCPKYEYRYLSWVHIITQSLSCSFKWRHRKQSFYITLEPASGMLQSTWLWTPFCFPDEVFSGGSVPGKPVAGESAFVWPTVLTTTF